MAKAQTCVITESRGPRYEDGWLTKVTWDWLSTDAGVVAAAGAEGVGATTLREFTGYVASFHTVPDGGDTVPSSYTITLYDADGRPMAAKAGASTSAYENHTSGHYVVESKLNIVISGAGDAKGGTAYAYIKE